MPEKLGRSVVDQSHSCPPKFTDDFERRNFCSFIRRATSLRSQGCWKAGACFDRIDVILLFLEVQSKLGNLVVGWGVWGVFRV